MLSLLGKVAISLAAVLAAVASAPAHAATYYVATNGYDNNAGTLAQPFASLNQAQTAASSGDTIYVRGGTYTNFTTTDTDFRTYYALHLTKDNISYLAYPGDSRPVLDFSAIIPYSNTYRVCALWVTGSGNTFQGFDVTGVKVGQNTQSDNWKITGNNNTWQQIVTRDDQGNGFYFYNSASNNLVKNCDCYNLIGVSGVSAGNTDGFGCHSSGSGNVFRYCRAWATSDDGYDSITNPGGAVTYDHCWAYDIGRYDGNSNGFKSGGFGYPPSRTNTSSNIVIGCVAAKCAGNGFYANYQPGQSAYWYNNTAFDNGSPTSGKTANINMQETEYSPASKVDGYREVMHNNLAFNDMGIANVIKLNTAASGSNVDDNFFTLPVTVDASDFASLDASQLTLPRNADGSLPDVTFMHLVAGSDLINVGMDLGYTYSGAAPDLGAFEYVPEPSTGLLLALALLTGIMLRRPRRS
jgi:hypothetical protein